MEDIQDNSQYASQQQLLYPFRISNRGLDSIDRYLTFNNTPHAKELNFLAQIGQKRLGQDSSSQIWTVEHSKKNRQLFYIKHQKTGLYLTFTKGRNVFQYIVQLQKQIEGQGALDQLWSFGMAQNRRFTIKVEPRKGDFYYLEYPQPYSLQQGYLNIFLCREQAYPSPQYHRNWKLSPVQPIQKQVEMIAENMFSGPEFFSGVELIKCFRGKIYTRKHPLYQQKAHQYASTSYPYDQTHPFLLAYPLDEQDITCMINTAKLLQKKITVRSGGHQYCGLSSGGQETVVICMDNFAEIVLNANGLVEVGPCVKLEIAAAKFHSWGISVPHGECPKVNIGGHGQTGGYGYFQRSFGLFIDYIQAFDIILADGIKRTVKRPQPIAVISNEQQRFDLQLFRGVLGGNAGSFGVITKYYLKGNKDSDHPESYGFSKVRFFERGRLQQLLKVYKNWSQLIVKKTDKQALKGLDLQITVGQMYIQLLNFKRPILILEGVYSDPDKGVPYNNQFKEMYDKFMEGQTLLQKAMNLFIGRWQGNYPLSFLNLKHVRQFPLVTSSGRQYDLPYEKRCNITMSALNNEFINEFLNQVEYVTSKKSVLVLIQTLCGGGAYRNNGNIIVDGLTVTSIPNRNLTNFFVYDIFYDTKTDPKAKEQAIRLQEKMQEIVNKYYSTPGIGEKRFFWGSFGNIDMTDGTVIDTYYDSRQSYELLQKLKVKVDENDLFHSPMTVKLPPQK